jgi:uncharacterized membrane protein YidH (DUF202 family)
MPRFVRPATHFDEGLQHERTALAWERTSISMMVVGIILARFAADAAHPAVAVAGLVQTVIGAGVLVWAGWHYEDLHGTLRDNDPVVHPTAARLLGLGTLAFSGFALVIAVLVATFDW